MQIVSVLCGVGEAVKGKNEKWLTGARYAHARDSTLHPRGGGDPPTERKKRGRTTKKLGGEDGKRATFRPHEARREQRRGARRTTVGRCKKKRASGGGIAEDFVTLPRKRDTPPSGADFRPPPLRPAAPMRRDPPPSPVTLKRP